MTSFDSWEVAVRPPEDYLMHFRTKGSKNGVRRYQTESGEWTELGLEERRKREGFGESKGERKARKQLERAERHQARKAARAQFKANMAEKWRKRSLKGLTDDEMKAKLARAKMEAEYRDLTKKGSLIESGAKLISNYLDYKDKKEQRKIDEGRIKVDMERAKADMVKAKEGSKRAKAEAKKAKEDRKTKEADVAGGLKLERKKDLIETKKEMKNYTIRGGIAKRINMALTSGKAKQYESIRKAKGDAEANRIRSNTDRNLRNEQALQRRKDQRSEQRRKERELAPERRRQERLNKEREKARKEYEKRMRRISGS